MDKITIREIALRCIIGIYPEERREKQDVIITITLHADLRRAAETDNVADTVDYKAVKKAVVNLVEGSSFMLVEALAQAVADKCLSFDGVQEADVVVEKPGALRFTRTVEVEMSRRRDG
ncbi:MAG: dihydroneopterin aldolase [Armatimonadetes bacterium]|nr:dihydroneopterin aldolase [Armatimonadota bacterium]